MTAIMKFINRERMPKIISWKKGVLPMKNQEQYMAAHTGSFLFYIAVCPCIAILVRTWHWLLQSLNGDAILEKGHWMILAFYLFWSFILPFAFTAAGRGVCAYLIMSIPRF